MWEEGACIYDTPGVHNNFPSFTDLPFQNPINAYYFVESPTTPPTKILAKTISLPDKCQTVSAGYNLQVS